MAEAMTDVLITIESFSGDRLARLKDALRGIESQLKHFSASSVFEASGEAVLEDGPVRGNWFPEREWGALTLAVLGQTTESPRSFYRKLTRLEELLNRTSRSIDIDMILYGDQIVMTPELTLPHPEFHLRPHLLIPAAEVAGEMIHPVLEKPVTELMEFFPKRNWGRYYAPGKALLQP